MGTGWTADRFYLFKLKKIKTREKKKQKQKIITYLTRISCRLTFNRTTDSGDTFEANQRISLDLFEQFFFLPLLLLF